MGSTDYREQEPGPIPKSILQQVGIERECWRHQRDIDRFSSRQDSVGGIVLVERREDGHFVAWIHDGHHRSHHGLRAATSHHDILIGIDGQSRKVAMLLGQCLTEVLRSPGDGILVRARRGNLCQTIGNFLWRVEIWESLREIDGSVLIGDAGHPSDNRIREACRSYG